VPLLDPGPLQTRAQAPGRADAEAPAQPANIAEAEAEDSDVDEVIAEDVDDLRDSFLPPACTNIDQLVHEMQQLFPSSRDPVLAARAKSEITEAYAAADLRCTVERAIADVGAFSFDPALLQRDWDGLMAAEWSLDEMVRSSQAIRRPSRLNPHRVRAALTEANPGWGKLMRFAEVGVEVSALLPPDFEPTGNDQENWPRLRPGYVEAHHVVNSALASSFHTSGVGIVLPLIALRPVPQACHVSTSNWAENKDKIRGRPTFNPKRLNSKHTKLAADALWGKVHHPSITTIVRMILAYMVKARARGVSREQLCLWKIDIQGAYTLLDYYFRDCRLFCSELSSDKVFVYTGGCFGWAGQPAAFDVVTRAIKYELPRILHGDADAYTDDFYGIAEDEVVDSDMAACEDLALTLLGPDAIAEDRRKSKKGKRLEIIGWLLDLLLQLVTIGRRCLLKALHGYLSVSEFAPIKLKTLQRMASWGVRYGEINTLMHPFTAVLYNESRGRTNPHCLVTLSSTGQRAVQMLRIITLLIAVDEPRFARPFSSWEIPDKLTGLFGQFDASLLGLGVFWFVVYTSGIVRLVGCSAVDLRSLKFGTDAGYQNVAEYIAAIATVRGAKMLCDRGLTIDGARPQGVWLKGDSATALSWMDKGRVRSTLAINASMVAVMQSVHSNMPVLGGYHVPAELNSLADKISRIAQTGRDLAELVRVTPELHGVEILDLKMDAVLPLCDPHKVVDSEAAFGAFWTRVREVLPLQRCCPQSTPSGVPLGVSDNSGGAGGGFPSESSLPPFFPADYPVHSLGCPPWCQ
jgi:hypothetical protein